jgi:L-seryl-tRNA(Ser) seleniumtransferase
VPVQRSSCDDKGSGDEADRTPMKNNSDASTTQNLRERDLYRLLPSVNELLLTPGCRCLLDSYPRHRLVAGVRATLSEIRQEIALDQHTADSLNFILATLTDRITKQLSTPRPYSLRPVINATGVILHTNLGRAPLSESALDHIVEVAQDYCNLELDLETGMRSRRDVHAETLLLKALKIDDAGQYSAVIVNNCAAATFLALNSLAEKREVIVSRGELVEIGGGFRIPEILEKSGAVLKEVGTTNRTRLSDYERALTSDTGLILRVHQSNFSIAGFTERPVVDELVSLARRAGVPLFEDQGTGLLASLEAYRIGGEPTLPDSLAHGVDLVAASGDKLLGGPQCGLLVGRTNLIQNIQRNPLLRAFRVDKLTYAALEATLFEYLSESLDSIPIHCMLGVRPEELMRRCRQIADGIHSARLAIDIVPVESLVGGGTAPKAALPSCAVSLRHASLTVEELSSALRHLDPPIVARICEGSVLLDLRTVPPRFDSDIAALLSKL